MSVQQLVARIKRSSKYWGQTAPNHWFDVHVVSGDTYCLRGACNSYRLADCALGIRLADGTIVDLSKARA